MPANERRQHFRIEDKVFFDYKILEPGSCYSDKAITDDLLGKNGKRYLETMQYFQSLDYELTEITQVLALKEPTLAHYLNLLNAKIDFLVRNLTMGDSTQLRKVDISLGGMAFNTKEKIKEKTYLKLIIYTKPKMVPIILNAVVVYSQPLNPGYYRTAVQFEGTTYEQEQLLSQHIMHAKISFQTNS